MLHAPLNNTKLLRLDVTEDCYLRAVRIINSREKSDGVKYLKQFETIRLKYFVTLRVVWTVMLRVVWTTTAQSCLDHIIQYTSRIENRVSVVLGFCIKFDQGGQASCALMLRRMLPCSAHIWKRLRLDVAEEWELELHAEGTHGPKFK